MRRNGALGLLVAIMLAAGCSSPNQKNGDHDKLILGTGIEPCVPYSEVKRLIGVDQSQLVVDFNFEEQVDESGFPSRYCTYKNWSGFEVLAIWTYRERHKREAYNGMVDQLRHSPAVTNEDKSMLPALGGATVLTVENRNSNLRGVLVSVSGATYNVQLPYSTPDAYKKAEGAVLWLLTHDEDGRLKV